MKINFDSLKPVYVQIAEAVEDDIISGSLTEGGAAYSQLIIARELNVNPATAAKGINVLVAKGILEKQRGASMVVAHGALERLLKERRENRFRKLVASIVSEAEKIKLSESEVIDEIKNHFKNNAGTATHDHPRTTEPAAHDSPQTATTKTTSHDHPQTTTTAAPTEKEEYPNE